MGTTEVAAFALRLAAVLVWLFAFEDLAFIPLRLLVYHRGMMPSHPAGYCIAFVLQLLFGAVLWITGPRIAMRLFAGSTHGAPGNADIGGLALCLSGVWLVDRAIQDSANLSWLALFGSLSAAGGDAFGGMVLAVLVLLLGGIALMVRGGAIARRLFRGELLIPPLGSQIATAAFAVLGLWMLADALTQVVYYGSDVLDYVRHANPEIQVSASEHPAWPRLWWGVARFAAGSALFLGARRIARPWNKASTHPGV